MLVPAQPAGAAWAYSAPLRTAARHLPLAAEQVGGYDRDRYFGGWTDADRDCRNTRAEVLQQESYVAVRYSSSGCSVASGRWWSYFSGRTYTYASQVQIDHLVPVAEAWDSGARLWTQARRVAFYNDLTDKRTLNAMDPSLNQAKAAKGPEEWLPPANRCRYIAEWIAVKHRWRFTVDSREKAALIRYADTCPNVTVSVQKV